MVIAFENTLHTLTLAGSSLIFVSCNNCETCVQERLPMDGGVPEAVMEEEVCGRQDIIDRGDEIINDVTFEGDTVLYQTYWKCSKD